VQQNKDISSDNLPDQKTLQANRNTILLRNPNQYSMIHAIHSGKAITDYKL
jgi:hypothetical protein